MLYEIETFVYDSLKNILYKKDLTDEQIKTINDNIKEDEMYHSEIIRLNKAQKNFVSFSQKTIERAGISLTFNCCLRCNYCSQSSVDGIEDCLSEEDIRAFLTDIVKKRVISAIAKNESPTLELYFTGGGEPTYNWDLFCSTILLVRKICSENDVELTLSLTSNCILNDAQRLFVAENFDKIMVSYDGITDIHNKNRKTKNDSSTAELVESNIKYFLNVGKYVVIRSTVWQDDFKRLIDMGKFIISQFPTISSWDINPVTPAGRAIEKMKSNKSLKENSFVDYFVQLVNFFETQETSIKVTSPLLAKGYTGFACGAITSNTESLWLFPNKKITTCIDSSEIINEVGKIDDGKVIFYEDYNDVILKMGLKKYVECRECFAFYVCGGGCPIKHIREEQFKTGMMDWECDMEKQYWKYVLSQLIKNGRYENVYLENICFPNISEHAPVYKIKWEDDET